MIVSSALFAIAFAVQANAAAISPNYDSDVPADIQSQMTQDLNFMTTIQGSGTSDLHQQIFGPVSGDSYKTFFESHVDGVGMNDCGNPHAVACVIPYMGKKMWLTQNFIQFSHPQVARMMIVYHESRHTEFEHENWPHATCPTPFLDTKGSDMKSIWTGASLAGEPACDITPMGSYGSSSILLKNIQKFCSNCTDKVKADAGMYADDQIGRMTDAQAVADMRKDIFN